MLQERCEAFQISPTSTSVFGQECPAGRTLAPRPGSGRCHRPWAKHHLLHPVEGHELARLVVALLAARLQVELVDAPVVEVLLEGDHAALLRVALS